MKLVKFNFEVKNHNNGTFTILKCHCVSFFGLNLMTTEFNYTFPGTIEVKSKNKVSEKVIKEVLGESLFSLIFYSKLLLPLKFWLEVKDNKVIKHPVDTFIERLLHHKSLKKTEIIVSNLLKEKLLNNPAQLKHFINNKKSVKLLVKTYFDKIQYGMSVEEFVRI